VSATHYSEDDLTLYYYGEGRRRAAIEQHLERCPACASTYREIAGTLAMIAAPGVPERGDQYGLEVWQRIRHQLPDRPAPWWAEFFRRDRLVFAAAAALLVLVAFAAGRVWPRLPAAAPAGVAPQTAARSSGAPGSIAAGDTRQRILLTSVADHLDRTGRMLTDIMNAPDRSDISTEQRWADDLLDASRLYRQDALDAGEQSVAGVLDDLERSLLEIVNSPAKITAADLEQLRRRIDAAALLFKVRVMSDELRKREDAPDRSLPRPSTSTRKTS
jgi:hypothetical protein